MGGAGKEEGSREEMIGIAFCVRGRRLATPPPQGCRRRRGGWG